MNNERRNRLNKALILLETDLQKARDIIDDVYLDEQCAMDGVPENLQMSYRYEQMEEAVSNIEEALSLIDSIDEDEDETAKKEQLKEIEEYIENAMF